LLVLGLCGCGGSGDDDDGGGGTPVNLVNFQAADAIIGQSAATTGAVNNGGGATPNASGLDGPSGHVGSGSLYVVDGVNNRILGFDAVPAGFGAAADFVLGQAAFDTNAPGTSATKFSEPSSCWVANDVLFVADADNSRVLLFSPPPTAIGAAASLALGRPDLTTSDPGTGTTGLNSPFDVCVAANRIVVADTGNRRVMIWNGIPAVSGAPAQVVVGQPDFTTVTQGATAAKMRSPVGVWTDGTRLVVADTDNNRVLIWTTFPTVNGQPADLVVGQPDFTTITSGNGASKLNRPTSVCSDGAKLFVADTRNHRVLIYSPFPTASNPAATGVLGQNGFTNVTANDDDQDGVADAAPTARTLASPVGVTTIGNQLFVNDFNNNRVLIFTGS
jgi:uncharacterized protein (DUF427 family)